MAFWKYVEKIQLRHQSKIQDYGEQHHCLDTGNVENLEHKYGGQNWPAGGIPGEI